MGGALYSYKVMFASVRKWELEIIIGYSSYFSDYKIQFNLLLQWEKGGMCRYFLEWQSMPLTPELGVPAFLMACAGSGFSAPGSSGAALHGASLWAPFSRQHLLTLCLCHVLVILKLFQTFCYYLLRWSAISAYDSRRAQMMVGVS